MRLHRLEMTAFGAFADHQAVDFDALSAAGLFLVVGPTGAGKSTILDAVTFALYGEAAGDRDRRGLRSQHAPAGVGPSVRLELTVRGRRLRITRTPQWQRPKQRGEGTVTEHPTVLVEECHPDRTRTTLATRLDEAGHFVGGLLGMSRAQFCQVALLPQNAFARFLRADSEERRKVLERLFAAQVFTSAEAWLAEHRTELGRQAERARQAVSTVVDRIAEAAGVGPDGADAAPGDDPDGLLAWVAGLRARAADRCAELAAATDAATAELTDRQDAVDAAGRLADRQARHAEYARRAADLAAHTAEREARGAELDAARRAAQVAGLLTELARHTQAVADAERQLAAAVRAAERAGLDGLSGTDTVASEPDASVWTDAERDRRDEVSRLDALRADATRLADLRTGVDQLDGEIDKLHAESVGLATELDGFPDTERRLAADLLAARTASAGVPAARAAVEAGTERLRAVRRRDALRDQVAVAESRLREAVTAAQDRREHWLAVREARLAGMAAELAGTLVGGQPCPVCGATAHPGPAVADADSPTRSDEQDAQLGYDTARATEQVARAEVERLHGELAGLAEVAGPGVGVADAEAALAASNAELAAAHQAADTAAELDAALAELTTRARQVGDRARAVTAALATAEAHRQDRVDEVTALAERVDRARGEDATLDARIARLTTEADLAAAVADRAATWRAATAACAAAERAAHAAAVGAGFAGTDHAVAASRDAEQIADLAEVCRRHDDEWAAVQAGLSDPDLLAAVAAAPPDLAATQAALDQARARHAAVLGERSRQAHRSDRLTELAGELDRAIDAWRPADHRYQVAHRMAQLAEGKSADNRLRMRLSAYVLAARMEQVVAEANHRLAEVSSGRYQLTHSTDRRTGERRGGLGLRVVDNWTGREREPASLSGGETFYVSLSLALGLMAVVTAEAGGVELDTLFVDEGFGALDEDTLDDVMGVLDGLRDGGRTVGLVSHVADLRTRVPTQLRVTKTTSGSTVSLHTG